MFVTSFQPARRMAKTSRKPSAPLTFDLPESLIARIETCRKGHGFATASEVVRTAIAGFDFNRCEPSRDPHRQISVRITADQRSTLKRFARQKDASVGELLRLALEALPTKGSGKKKK
jgi:Arc/MetJ-type ribon-helix-helix transcriptional regulator